MFISVGLTKGLCVQIFVSCNIPNFKIAFKAERIEIMGESVVRIKIF